MKFLKKHKYYSIIITFILLTTTIYSDTGGTKITQLQNNINIIWTSIAAFLVFFMQAGFAMVESGFTRAKNTINIMMKNLMDFSIGTVAFFLVGFGLMFGASNGFFGTTH